MAKPLPIPECVSAPAALPAFRAAAIEAAWRHSVPTLTGVLVQLRELEVADAPALFSAMSNERVVRFISPPPSTLDGFERFVAWSHRERAAGHVASFCVVPRNSDVAIGLFQVRSLEPDFGSAEWGFAIAQEFWGTGAFADAATLVLDFAFTVLGTHRIEARAATVNGRGNEALRKLGAVREGVLRKSFVRGGEYYDQALWTIRADEWLDAKATWGSPILH
jgi:RimJ/RimL family protein N-acetyltransferase